jgi:hypothetical protein
VRIFGISIDSPQQNSAVVKMLDLPFPLLSDPDRSAAISPHGVADEKDARNISRPAMVVIDPAGDEVFRFVSRDFADRLAEDEVLEEVKRIGFAPITQEAPQVVDPRPGPKAFPLEGLPYYYRGAKFAAQAMGIRHGRFAEEIKEDSKAYVARMDRYMANVETLRSRLA